MNAALTSLATPSSSTLQVAEALWAPVNEAAGWLDQPPLVLLLMVVLTGVLLMARPLPVHEPSA